MHRATLVAGFALAACGAALPAAAQDLTYTTTTKMEMSGTLGRVLSVVGKMDEPMVEKTYLQGPRIRKDQDESSTIMDWEAGAMTLLDHPEKTFMRVDFAQMMEQMAGAMGQERADAGEAPEMEVTVSADRTGKTENIAGYVAEQVVLTVEMKPKSVEGEEGAAPTTALVTDLWLSTEFPEYRMMQEMKGEAIERFREGGASQGIAQAMGALAGANPGMEEGWQKNMEAMKELQGTALRSTTHFVTVPPGATLDRDQVLASAGEGVSEGGGGGAAAAARQALGGLAGRFGRGRPQQQEAAAAPTAQVVTMRIKTEISDVGTGAVDPSLFLVPDGYTEKTPPTGR